LEPGHSELPVSKSRWRGDAGICQMIKSMVSGPQKMMNPPQEDPVDLENVEGHLRGSSISCVFPEHNCDHGVQCYIPKGGRERKILYRRPKNTPILQSIMQIQIEHVDNLIKRSQKWTKETFMATGRGCHHNVERVGGLLGEWLRKRGYVWEPVERFS
ncbi:hypothetical protein U1Q18_030537, partial [Sarracenia purpurea var. burkii]